MQNQQMPQANMPAPAPQMPQGNMPNPISPKPKSKNVWLWSALAVVVLLALGAAVYLNQGSLFKGQLTGTPTLASLRFASATDSSVVDQFKNQFNTDLGAGNNVSAAFNDTNGNNYTFKAPANQGITFNTDGSVNIDRSKTPNVNFTFFSAVQSLSAQISTQKQLDYQTAQTQTFQSQTKTATTQPLDQTKTATAADFIVTNTSASFDFDVPTATTTNGKFTFDLQAPTSGTLNFTSGCGVDTSSISIAQGQNTGLTVTSTAVSGGTTAACSVNFIDAGNNTIDLTSTFSTQLIDAVKAASARLTDIQNTLAQATVTYLNDKTLKLTFSKQIDGKWTFSSTCSATFDSASNSITASPSSDCNVSLDDSAGDHITFGNLFSQYPNSGTAAVIQSGAGGSANDYSPTGSSTNTDTSGGTATGTVMLAQPSAYIPYAHAAGGAPMATIDQNGVVTIDLTGVPNGTYTVDVKDSSNNTKFTITITVSGSDLICNDLSGAFPTGYPVSVATDNANDPNAIRAYVGHKNFDQVTGFIPNNSYDISQCLNSLQFTFQRTPASTYTGKVSDLMNSGFMQAGNGLSFDFSKTISGEELPAGSYSMKVSDNSGHPLYNFPKITLVNPLTVQKPATGSSYDFNTNLPFEFTYNVLNSPSQTASQSLLLTSESTVLPKPFQYFDTTQKDHTLAPGSPSVTPSAPASNGDIQFSHNLATYFYPDNKTALDGASPKVMSLKLDIKGDVPEHDISVSQDVPYLSPSTPSTPSSSDLTVDYDGTINSAVTLNDKGVSALKFIVTNNTNTDLYLNALKLQGYINVDKDNYTLGKDVSLDTHVSDFVQDTTLTESPLGVMANGNFDQNGDANYTFNNSKIPANSKINFELKMDMRNQHPTQGDTKIVVVPASFQFTASPAPTVDNKIFAPSGPTDPVQFIEIAKTCKDVDKVVIQPDAQNYTLGQPTSFLTSTLQFHQTDGVISTNFDNFCQKSMQAVIGDTQHLGFQITDSAKNVYQQVLDTSTVANTPNASVSMFKDFFIFKMDSQNQAIDLIFDPSKNPSGNGLEQGSYVMQMYQTLPTIPGSYVIDPTRHVPGGQLTLNVNAASQPASPTPPTPPATPVTPTVINNYYTTTTTTTTPTNPTTTTVPAATYTCTIGGVVYQVVDQATCDKLNSVFQADLPASTPQNRVNTALAILRVLGNNFKLRANLGTDWYGRFVDASTIADAQPQQITDSRSAYSADILQGRVSPQNPDQVTLAPFDQISKAELFTMFEQAYAAINGPQTININNLPVWLQQAYQSNSQLEWIARGYSFAVSKGIININEFTNMSQLLQIAVRSDLIHYMDNFAYSIGSNVSASTALGQ